MSDRRAGGRRSGLLPRGRAADAPDARMGVIPREEVERIVASCDRTALACAAYGEAFPNPAAHVHGQAVLDLSTGEVRASAYVEGHADDPRYGHLLPLAECCTELKESLREEEFVRLFRHDRGPTADIAARLDAFYGGSNDQRVRHAMDHQKRKETTRGG